MNSTIPYYSSQPFFTAKFWSSHVIGLDIDWSWNISYSDWLFTQIPSLPIEQVINLRKVGRGNLVFGSNFGTDLWGLVATSWSVTQCTHATELSVDRWEHQGFLAKWSNNSDQQSHTQWPILKFQPAFLYSKIPACLYSKVLIFPCYRIGYRFKLKYFLFWLALHTDSLIAHWASHQPQKSGKWELGIWDRSLRASCY